MSKNKKLPHRRQIKKRVTQWVVWDDEPTPTTGAPGATAAAPIADRQLEDAPPVPPELRPQYHDASPSRLVRWLPHIGIAVTVITLIVGVAYRFSHLETKVDGIDRDLEQLKGQTNTLSQESARTRAKLEHVDSELERLERTKANAKVGHP